MLPTVCVFSTCILSLHLLTDPAGIVIPRAKFGDDKELLKIIDDPVGRRWMGPYVPALPPTSPATPLTQISYQQRTHHGVPAPEARALQHGPPAPVARGR